MDWPATLTASATLLTALGTLWASIRNGRKVEEVHKSINSRMDQLVTASVSQGRQDERDDQKKDKNVWP
jgi:hypothetical protein